jgi:hypothetical protein
VNRRVVYLAGLAVAGALVWAGGRAMSPEGVRGVTVGVLLGVGFQLLMFGVMVAVFPSRPMAAFGMGLLGRMVLVVAAALVIVPAAGLPPAPFLFSLVTVLFTTTLLEPVLMGSARKNDAR